MNSVEEYKTIVKEEEKIFFEELSIEILSKCLNSDDENYSDMVITNGQVYNFYKIIESSVNNIILNKDNEKYILNIVNVIIESLKLRYKYIIPKVEVDNIIDVVYDYVCNISNDFNKVINRYNFKKMTIDILTKEYYFNKHKQNKKSEYITF